MSDDRRTVIFFPEGAFGPTNNCVGIANVLKSRGARCIFVVEESFAGTLQAKGFEEALMRLQPPPEVPEEPGQYWKDFIRDTAPEFRKTTYDQLEGFIKPVWEGLVDGARYVDERLREIFDEIRPDVIVEDNVVGFPAVPASGYPWARIMSCNPLEMKDPGIPPVFSGMASDETSGWVAFRTHYREVHREMQRDFSEFCVSRGAPPLSDTEFIWESPFLNMLLYPQEADYTRTSSLGSTWHRLPTCVRDTDEPFEIPASLGAEGKLIYLSLGSLGSADVELMQRLIDLLGKMPHRVIVSMGPQHDLLTLADNMWGSEFVPQTSILPQVDLVITHGGNNTVTECMYFSKPMLVLPLFWDQYDNAQRMHEIGFGIRLATYAFGDHEFLMSIEDLLSNEERLTRMRELSRTLKAQPGTVIAADLIDRLARERAPIT
jgi:MGT family glycosyltransferase